MADVLSADARGSRLLPVSSDHHHLFFILLRELPFQSWPPPSWRRRNCCLTNGADWEIQAFFSSFHYEYESIGSDLTAAGWGGGGGLTTDGTCIDPHMEGSGEEGGGKAEPSEWADYGNASTDRSEGCAFEAQEFSNKSPVPPALTCLGRQRDGDRMPSSNCGQTHQEGIYTTKTCLCCINKWQTS